jgi:hypothetical protein
MREISAAELVVANTKLVFQDRKEKQTAELMLLELTFQNKEKKIVQLISCC